MGSISIIGNGYVGSAVASLFAQTFPLITYDPKLVQVPAREEINNADMAIICVPTPKNADGTVDLSIINDVIGWVETPLIVIKSTVPPGTTEHLRETTGKRIVFSPEFIGESKYVVPWWKGYPHATDMRYHDFQIFGGDRADVHCVMQYFKKVLGPAIRYVQTDATTAELVKYMLNSWGAMKVTFANEFYEIAKTFGVDYDELREIGLLNGYMERMHTMVFEDNRGFGGKCLPKDIHGIVKAAQQMGYDPKLLQQVIASNDVFVAKNPGADT